MGISAEQGPIQPDAELLRLLEHWPDAALLVDRRGRLLAANAKALAILDWDSASYREEHVHLHDSLCAALRGLHHSAHACPFKRPDEHAHWHSLLWRTAEGACLPVDARATPLAAPWHFGVVWSFSPNAEDRHNQAELEKFAQCVEMSPAPIAEFDLHGQLLFGNAALHSVMLEAGFTDDGHNRVFPLQLPALCAELTEDKTALDPLLIECPTAKGVAHWQWHLGRLPSALAELNPDEDPADTILGFAFDVTAQKEAEAALLREQTEARRDFYAKMMHELRTPLNAIMGFSDLLIRRASDRLNEREISNLKAIKNAGFQLNELVTDTLDISKIEAGHMALDVSCFNIREQCEAFLPQLQSLAEAKRLNWFCDISTRQEMTSDRQKFRQIVVNLLSNAIKYTQQGSVTLRVEAPGDHCIVTISDTGLGIAPEQQAKLFQKYHQIKEAKNRDIQGTGLGLALVAELVAMLGGTISVESEYGKGSCFSVTLPRHLQPDAALS